MPTKFSYVFLGLIFSCLFFFLGHSSNLDQSTEVTKESTLSRSLQSISFDQSEDLKLTPGITKRIMIQLKGETEEIIYAFEADEVEASAFYVSILVNHKNESTNIYKFSEPEDLSVRIDYEAQNSVVSGDKDFLLSNPIKDDYYEITTSQDKIKITIDDQSFSDKDNSKISETLICSIFGGSCAVILLLFIIYLRMRRRGRKAEILPAQTEQDLNVANRLDTEVVYTSRALIENNNVKKRNDINQEHLETSCGENCPDMASVQAKLSKKESSRSQASTIPSLSRLNSQHSYKSSTASNMRFLSSDGNALETEAEAIHEVDDDNKAACSQYMSLEDCRDCQNDLPSDRNEADNSDLVVSNLDKITEEENARDKRHVEIILDMDLGSEKTGRRMPTISEIGALVRKMREEGTLGCECDPSEESDDEDQYEAPVLPNYFCCMLCFEGRRCTIVEPCRHVFACKECVEDLLNTYKICVLCANSFTSYESL